MEEVIFINENGERFQLNKDEYGGTIQYDSGVTPKQSVYSDRMHGWDYKKFNECCREVWGNEGQAFYSDRTPDEVQKFLRLYTGDETLELCRIIHYENQSNGYPVWRFDYNTKN
jgi:hypothetical protein